MSLILKKYKVPATIFLPVNYVDSDKQFWQEKLTGILINIYHMANKNTDKRQKYFDKLGKYNLQDIDQNNLVIKAVKLLKSGGKLLQWGREYFEYLLEKEVSI